MAIGFVTAISSVVVRPLPVMAVVAPFSSCCAWLGRPGGDHRRKDVVSVAAVRAKPLAVEQFVVWLAGAAAGRLGVVDLLNLPVTRLMAAGRTDSAHPVDSVRRRCSPHRRGRGEGAQAVDRLVMGFAVLGFAMPVLVLATY
jgi:hypothetical protein